MLGMFLLDFPLNKEQGNSNMKWDVRERLDIYKQYVTRLFFSVEASQYVLLRNNFSAQIEEFGIPIALMLC